MNLKIIPNSLSGKVEIPGSKSITHRALICASLCDDVSIIKNPLICNDTFETMSILKALGVTFNVYKDHIEVIPPKKLEVIDSFVCMESASTLRFLIPLLSTISNDIKIHTSNRMIERINTEDLFDLKGLNFSFEDSLIRIKGKIHNKIKLKSNITSQWISGMLLLSPIYQIDLEVDNIGGYTEITIDTMALFGITFDKDYIPRGKYQANEITVEVDYSSASYFLAMSMFNNVTVINTKGESKQPDAIFKYVLENINDLKSINLKDAPDVAMLVAAVFAVTPGKRRITGLEKLKHKESNRLWAIFKALSLLGADIELDNDTLILDGKEFLYGDVAIESLNDHRVLMSIVAISSKIKKPFIITDKECINKSFPNFLKEFASIGGLYEDSLSKSTS